MRNPSPAERIAEAPPATHPAILDRLVGQIQDVTLLLATSEPATFATGEPAEALNELRAAAGVLAERADSVRPTIHPRP